MARSREDKLNVRSSNNKTLNKVKD